MQANSGSQQKAAAAESVCFQTRCCIGLLSPLAKNEAMISGKQPKEVFDPDELHVLDVALRSTLWALWQQGLQPRPELKAALSYELLFVAQDGVTNPQELQAQLLERIGLYSRDQ